MASGTHRRPRWYDGEARAVAILVVCLLFLVFAIVLGSHGHS